MKLTELEPRWIHPHVFVFLCPHCKTQLLSCKNVVMSQKDQYALFEKEFGAEKRWPVGMVADCAWTISGTDFATMTVTPSIDASKSRHWHGCITKGEIQ